MALKGQYKDIVGVKYGRLTVKELYDYQGKKGYFWVCECKCGVLKIFQGTSLRSKHGARSCGCLKSEFEDLSGKKFNKLKVCKLDKKIGRRRYWLCKCDCGKIKSIREDSFLKGHTKSCGCLQGEVHEEITYRALHGWVQRNLGKADRCEHCKTVQKRYEWANISHEYKIDLKDWISLCVSCHKKFDKDKPRLRYLKK